MKISLPALIVLVVVAATMPCLTGCGTADRESAVQNKEEMRQQQIDRAAKMRKEMRHTK